MHVRFLARAAWTAALAAGLALAACGATTTPAPSSSGRAAGTAGPPTGSRYAQDYRPNGSAVIVAGRTLTVTMTDYQFAPNTLTVAEGTPVAIRLVNRSASGSTHNFSLDAWQVSQTVNAGSTATFTFTPAATGTYYFYCNVPGHADLGMVGTLTVTRAGSASGNSSPGGPGAGASSAPPSVPPGVASRAPVGASPAPSATNPAR